MDFVKITETVPKKRSDAVEIKPKFIVNPDTEDLMIRGGDFYAVWDEESGLWSTNESTVIKLIDRDISEAADKREEKGDEVKRFYMWDSDSGSIDKFHKFCQKQMRENWHQLDTKITFKNEKPKKSDYASKRLPYSLAEGDISAYEEIMSTLYDPDERRKIEWAIGSVIAGDSKKIQKFIVLYGSAGTGKSTVLNIIQMLFEGYYKSFKCQELGSANATFGLEAFKSNPLIAIDHEAKLDKIDDNTKLNSIISHDIMEINAKFEKKYDLKLNTFLFIASNNPVKITDAKSGIIRRLIDVKPTGKLISPESKYFDLMKRVEFELGAIAQHCLDIYKELGKSYYSSYVAKDMISATNDFYDFISHEYDHFRDAEVVTLVEAWKAYKDYCEYANCFQMPMRIMQTELRNYFKDFDERKIVNGKWLRNVYSGFLTDKFESKKEVKPGEKEKKPDSWLQLIFEKSLFDEQFAECPAQYEINYDGKDQPEKKWSNVKTKLKDLDTAKTHYVKTPGYLVMIDFDKRGPDGKKSLELNLEAASRWPKTYAELSKSGCGIHLYYIYEGDVNELFSIYEENVEIKVFPDDKKGAIRRKLVKCNDIPIATINAGLPLKVGKSKSMDWDGKITQDSIVTRIKNNLAKQYHADTSSSINFIKKILDDAYESGITYDVSYLYDDVRRFAENSTNQSERCLKVVDEMHFKSAEDISRWQFMIEGRMRRPIILDCEIYRPDEETDNPGLFLICWKYYGAPPDSIVDMVNPAPHEVEQLFGLPWVTFNGREYDNHMIYARSLGESNMELYTRSQGIITYHDFNAKFNVARNASWCDVYEYCIAAGERMGLKKWEIKLGIDHKEMGIPWDQPAPKDRWPEIIAYCHNDVLATEAVFMHTQNYFKARQFQVRLAKALHGESINVRENDTANTLSKRIIFGNDRKPQRQFNYRNLALPVGSDQYDEYRKKFGENYRFRVFDADGLPQYRDYIPGEVLPDGWSILPFFPGYEFDPNGKKGEKSLYLGEFVGEGGRVYSKEGAYVNMWDGDVSSMHPHSVIYEVLFGPEYTKIFEEIVKARVAVKHHDFELAGSMLNGVLKDFLDDDSYKDLAQAMKIIVNSVYGLTKAGFDNEFRDPRNIDNLVAKRGCLFMTLLKREIERKGYQVAHIKTDSIKIPDATEEIKDFVIKFGREYGYEFETEGDFVKFVLLNDASYAAKEKNGTWITKAAQLQEPFVRKTLFTHEEIEFSDLCLTFNTTEGALYLDMNEDLIDPESSEKKADYFRKKIADGKLAKGYGSIEEMQKDLNILEEEAKKGHNYVFIGKVSSFCPVVPGAGGGKLYRIQNGKPFKAAGTSDWRFLESNHIKQYGMQDKIDMRYFYKLVDEAKEDISKYCDVEWFVSDEPVDDFMNIPEGSPEEVPM